MVKLVPAIPEIVNDAAVGAGLEGGTVIPPVTVRLPSGPIVIVPPVPGKILPNERSTILVMVIGVMMVAVAVAVAVTVTVSAEAIAA